MSSTIKDICILTIIICLVIAIVSILFAPDKIKSADLVNPEPDKITKSIIESQTLETHQIVKQDPIEKQTEITSEYLNSMKLHDIAYTENKNVLIMIIKVPNGWIYNVDDCPIFIPERK